jgi:hypothetical protein
MPSSMLRNPDLPKLAAVGGNAKEARRTAARTRLTDKLIAFDSVEDVQTNLETLARLSAQGLITGSQAGSAVRACEVWLRAEQHAMDVQKLRQLEREVERLEAELKRARASALRVN